MVVVTIVIVELLNCSFGKIGQLSDRALLLLEKCVFRIGVLVK